MLYRFYPPTRRLSAFVASFWLYRNDPQPPSRVLPSGTAQVVIDLSGGGLTLPRPGPGPHPISTACSRDACPALLHGVDSTSFLHENDRPLYGFGVDFKPGCLSPFFAPPASELHNVHLSLDALWGAQVVRELCERMAEADTLEERVGIVEEVLLRQLVRPLDHHPAVSSALRALSSPTLLSIGRTDARLAPVARIAQIAEDAGLSRGHFTRLFQQRVGLTPKHYARVRRFLRVVQSTRTQQTEQRVNWAHIAADCGYYDQAHLIKDFQAFAGVCPSAYLRARSSHSPSRLLLAD
jgi:AraC-like DNA-binding protein